MIFKPKAILCLLMFFLLIVGCSTKVTRVQRIRQLILQANGMIQFRLVAEEMIRDCLSQRWLYKWESENRRPTVIVGKIVNKSHEHISVETLSKMLRGHFELRESGFRGYQD